MALARAGGTVVLAGTRGSGATPGFDPDHVVYKELRLLGALGVDVAAYRAAFALLADAAFPLHGVAAHGHRARRRGRARREPWPARRRVRARCTA